MNKLLSSMMLATLTLLTTLPFSMAPVAAAGGSIISVDPSLSAGHIGDTFQVTVDLTNQPGLVGYDFSVRYNNAVLACVGYDDHSMATILGPFAASGRAISFVSECAQATAVAEGVARSAAALTGGISTNVLSAPLAIITFQVIGNGDSDLVITNDQLACASGSSTGPCAPHTDINAVFLIAPDVFFRPPGAIQGFSPVVHLRTGQTTIQYNVTIQLSPSDVRAGFGGALLTATDPLGNQIQGQSDIAFMFQGQTVVVIVVLDFSSTPTIGNWAVSATVLDCANPSVCIAGPTQAAHPFKIKS